MASASRSMKVGDIVKELSGNNSCEGVAASTSRELRELAGFADDPGQLHELIDRFSESWIQR
jgi:hypothetical protein